MGLTEQEQLEIITYVPWANTLDSTGKDSGPAIERATADELILGSIHRNIWNIIETGQHADQLKKWVFYGKESERVIPSHFIRTDERDMARINLDDHNTMRLYHALLGILSEVAELFEMFEAHIFKGRAIDWDNFTEEVGDIFWYLALCAKCKDYPTFLPFLVSNRAKLTERYGDTWSQNAALYRDIPMEMQAMRDSLESDPVKPLAETCLCYYGQFNSECPIHGYNRPKVASMQGIPEAQTGTCPRCYHAWHGERGKCEAKVNDGMANDGDCGCTGAFRTREDVPFEGDSGYGTRMG